MHVLGEWVSPLSFPVLPSTAPCLGHGVALTYFGGTWKGKGPSGCIRRLWACFVSRRQMKGLSLSAKYGSAPARCSLPAWGRGQAGKSPSSSIWGLMDWGLGD